MIALEKSFRSIYSNTHLNSPETVPLKEISPLTWSEHFFLLEIDQHGTKKLNFMLISNPKRKSKLSAPKKD